MSKASYVEVIYDIFVGNKDWKELLQVCRLAIYQIYLNFSVLQLFKINLALGTGFRERQFNFKIIELNIEHVRN